MGKNFERTQQVRERFVRKISNSRRRRNWFSTNGATQFPRIENRTAFSKGNRQTQRRGKIGAEFKFYSAAFFGTNSDSWEEMAWYWTDSGKVHYSRSWRPEGNDYIASTWTKYSSWRRRSSWIWETEERHQRTSTPIFHSVRRSNNTWINNFERGGGRKKRFQFCTNRKGTVILYFRTIKSN